MTEKSVDTQPEEPVTAPVFVDGSGRRQRIAALLAAVLGLGILFGLMMVTVSFVGASSVPLPGLPVTDDPLPDEVHQPDFYPASGLAIPGPGVAGNAPARGVVPAPPGPNANLVGRPYANLYPYVPTPNLPVRR
jgi:hypothetical protein